MQGLIRIREWVNDSLWGEDLAAASPLRVRLIMLARVLYAVGRDLGEGQLTLRAMSLVYTTLLSLVPLLALSFSVLKAFGVHNQVRPMLLTLLEPLGEKGVEITAQVIGFVENVRVGVLGALGLALLVYTVTALLQKIELTFNHVWRVKRARPLAQRFSQYLSVLMVGPVLVFSALGITATLLNSAVVQALIAIEPFGTLIEFAGRLVPYLLVIAAFAFFYVFIPNTRVQMRSALVGAVIAGVLWQTTGWVFASFVVASTKYTAIYSGFAIVIMSMIWLYLNWLILLVGASLAFYHQHPEHLSSRRRELQLSNRVKERLALLAGTLVARHYYRQQPAWTLEALAQRLGAPLEAVESVVRAMQVRGVLSQTAEEPPRYLPARPPETVAVRELLDAVRTAEEGPHLTVAQLPHEPEVDKIVERLDRAMVESLHGHTLKDLGATATVSLAPDAAAPPPQESVAP